MAGNLSGCLSFLYYLIGSNLKSKMLPLDMTIFMFRSRMYVRLCIESAEWMKYNKCEIAIEFVKLAPMVREMEKCKEKNEIVGYEPLVNDLKQLIQKKQYQVLRMINSETINLYWEIGEEIYRQQQENGWGKSIVQVLSNELQKEFPGAKGYSAANLWRMRNFYLTYRESEKLAPLVREISWSNNVVIMEKCKDDLQREFYIQMTKRYGWTKRVLTNVTGIFRA